MNPELGYSCVPYYQCSNGSIVTDGAGLIDIRNGFGALNPEASKCPGFLDVCCKVSSHWRTRTQCSSLIGQGWGPWQFFTGTVVRAFRLNNVFPSNTFLGVGALGALCR